MAITMGDVQYALIIFSFLGTGLFVADRLISNLRTRRLFDRVIFIVMLMVMGVFALHNTFLLMVGR